MTTTMTDRFCVVTGANTGIGRATAVELGRLGARVVLACRSLDKTQPVLDEINDEAGEERASFLALDLGNLDRVRAAAAELLERGDPIHVLINNAGLAGHRGVTDDGFEVQFGVNHLGPFLFTNLLLDRIIESAPARIVNVASRAHFQARAGIPWDTVQGKTRSLTGIREYGVSKLANVLFSAELARRLEGAGVTTYSLHPGVIASDVWRRMPWPIRPAIKVLMKSTEEGALTSLHCATSDEAGGETGLYYDNSAPKKPSRKGSDAELAAELWTRSEAWCGLAAAAP